MKEILNDKGTLTIQCKNCSVTFSLSKEEQEWYRSRGYSLPKRCSVCRRLDRAKRNTDGHKPFTKDGLLNIFPE